MQYRAALYKVFPQPALAYHTLTTIFPLAFPPSRTVGVLPTMLSGLVNMFLILLATRTVSLEDSNLLSHGMMNVGLRTVLRDNFGIYIGFVSMKPLDHT